MSEEPTDLKIEVVVDEGSTTKITPEPDEVDVVKAAEEEDEHTEAQTDAEAD
ncbi:MAG: hypothetical protein ACI9BF_000476 [Candidatus Paceibacteria bacterium]|jgi:hypothetical protein